MLTYDHDGNYNITIISKNNDDGDHFQGRCQHHHQHHHLLVQLPMYHHYQQLLVQASNHRQCPLLLTPVVMMLLVVVTMQHLGWDGCSALAYLSSEVLCQLCMFITSTDAAFIICGIHFNRTVLMIKLFT